MATVYAFLANGSEEVECLACVDVLRRAGIDTRLVAVGGELKIKGSHGIEIVCDSLIEETELSSADVLFLPGGMPGTLNLGADRRLCEALLRQAREGRRIAAICAAPSVLGGLGLLKGKKATCYPGFEDKLEGACHSSDGVVTDGNITTARGLGYALELGLELIRLLCGEERSMEIKSSIQYDK